MADKDDNGQGERHSYKSSLELRTIQRGITNIDYIDYASEVTNAINENDYGKAIDGLLNSYYQAIPEHQDEWYTTLDTARRQLIEQKESLESKIETVTLLQKMVGALRTREWQSYPNEETSGDRLGALLSRFPDPIPLVEKDK